MSATTPYDLLGEYPDRTRPLVTHYDGADSRVELSVASVANAVAKAASMLRDGLGLPPGAVVSIDLPRHWQLPVWVLAALSVGATVGRDLAGSDLAAPIDVRIVGPQGLAAIAGGADPDADEVLACSCDAFGLPVPGGVPAGVIDIGVEVRAHPDQFRPEPDAARTAALLVHGVPVPWATPRPPPVRSRVPGSGSMRTPRSRCCCTPSRSSRCWLGDRWSSEPGWTPNVRRASAPPSPSRLPPGSDAPTSPAEPGRAPARRCADWCVPAGHGPRDG